METSTISLESKGDSVTINQKHEEWKRSQPYPVDKYGLDCIKMGVREWLTTYGQIQMGDEIADDLCMVIELSYKHSLSVRRQWEGKNKSKQGDA